MKIPKPVFDDADGDGVVDQLDKEPKHRQVALLIHTVLPKIQMVMVLQIVKTSN